MKVLPKALIPLLISFLLLSVSVLGQEEKTEEEKEFDKKVSKLMTGVIDSVPNLRLWENRSLMYAGLGNMLWENDQKQAKLLFRLASEELANGIDPPVVQTTDWNARSIRRSNFSPRRSVILTISVNDPVFALSVLKTSRPLKIQEAMNKLAAFPADTSALTDKQKREASNAKRRVGYELTLEQGIAESAAKKDPKVAAKLLKESLKKGVSRKAVKLLFTIAERDIELAQSLKSDLLSKLVDSPANDEDSERRFSLQAILMKYSEPKEGKKAEPLFGSEDLSSVANKLADVYVKMKNVRYASFLFDNDVPLILKYAPERKVELDRKKKFIDERTNPIFRRSSEIQRITRDKSLSPVDLINKAAGVSGYLKTVLYNEAIKRGLNSGKLDEVRSALESEPASAEKDTALNDLGAKESKAATKSGNAGKIDQLVAAASTDLAKVKLLSNAALTLSKQEDEENQELSKEYLTEAKRIAGNQITTREDVEIHLELLSAVAAIEPEGALETLEKLVFLVNRLSSASKVLNEYDNRTPYAYEGEYFFPNIFRKRFEKHSGAVKLVAEEELDEMLEISRRLNEPELRLLAQFVILQGIHREKLGFRENRALILTSYSNL